MSTYRSPTLALIAFTLLGCSGAAVRPNQTVAPKTETPRAPPEPLCKVLQPQFDRLTERFNLGGKLNCEEVPGFVTLGQFGTNQSLDRNLVACVDDNAHLIQATQFEPAAVAGVEYETETNASTNGVLGLGLIAPWLPNVRAESSAGQKLKMKLSIADATWDTIPALAKVFEGQNHAYDCLPALCQDTAQVAYKVLRGKVRVELSSAKANGLAGSIQLVGGTAGFAVEESTRTTSTVTLGSSEKLVLGVIAKPSKNELIDASQCDGCGARGQPCCGGDNKCDSSLSCVDGTCRPNGYPGAPCDEDRCTGGAACVRRVCQAGCGAAGLPCCDGDACSRGLQCQSGQRARREVSVFDQLVTRSGGLFGTDVDLDLGSATCGNGRLRSRFTTMKTAGDSSHCDQASWMASNDPNDCRVRVHLHVSFFSEIRCHVQIFTTEVDAQVPAPQALCK